MTNYVAVLRELMIAGYEGAALLAAFDRLCAAIGGHGAQAEAMAPPKAARASSAPPMTAGQAAPFEGGAVAITAPPENAKAIARKAIAQSMLSASAIAVASHLIESFNLKTGRCDPGVGSMARELGLSRRTIYRAICDLVSAGLFGRRRHGGRGHANAYQPNWPVLVARAAEGDLGTVTKLARNGDSSVTQNHLKKPDSDSLPVQPQRRRAAQREPDRQIPMMLPMAGGKARSIEAVRSRLHSEMDAHLRGLFMPHDKAGFIIGMTALTEIGGAWDQAISAEMARGGSGLPILLTAIAARNGQRRAG